MIHSLLLSYTQANRVRRGRGEIALQAADSPPTLLPAHLALTPAITASTHPSTSHLEADQRVGGALTVLSLQQHHLQSRELDPRLVSAQPGGFQGPPASEEQRTYSGYNGGSRRSARMRPQARKSLQQLIDCGAACAQAKVEQSEWS